MRSIRLLTLSGLWLPSLLAGQTADPVESLVGAERNAVAAVTREGLARGLHSVLAPRGAVLWPGAPVVAGADSVGALLLAQRSLDSLRITWQPLGVELAGDGTLGVTWGVAAAIPPSREARLGRYIAAWQRAEDGWRLAAFVVTGLLPANLTTLPAGFTRLRYPPLAAQGSDAGFPAADLAFARLAGDSGAAVAFERFAAPDAVTFSGGVLNRGPRAIGHALRADRSRWTWHPVLAGSSASGELGWTIGESEIRPESGAVSYGKYLTIWRRSSNGEVRYLIDAGNARPSTP